MAPYIGITCFTSCSVVSTCSSINTKVQGNTLSVNMIYPLNLNIILWMVFLSPLILWWITCFIILPICVILNIAYIILKKLFCNPCSSSVVVDLKLVCRTAWMTARHPSIILDMLNRFLFEIKEKNKQAQLGVPHSEIQVELD